jgi:AP2-associated kinase
LQVKEIHALNEEIGRVTTLQYRAPELCDLYQKLGIDEKVDIWALGVVLYKLCYFTTPFEESGQVIVYILFECQSLKKLPPSLSTHF